MTEVLSDDRRAGGPVPHGEPAPTPEAVDARRVVRRRGDLLGILWVVAAGIAPLVPSLLHATTIHDPTAADQANQIIPWTRLAWTQVHQGHLPLWNPYSLLGMPLAFNWQSGAFGIAGLVGYLFPLNLAFAAGIVTTVVVAGSGMYVLGRVLRIGVLGAATAATVFELSGPFMSWLGWPVDGVMSFAGWILAGVVLVVAGRRRVLGICLLAVSVAGSIYAGQVDTLGVLAVGVLVFAGALLVQRLPALGGSGPILRPAVDLVLGGVAGAGLGAPLLIPGLQLVRGSIRSSASVGVSLPVKAGVTMLVPGRGLLGSGYSPPYIGPVALVLAGVAVVVYRHRASVRAFAALLATGILLGFQTPVLTVVNQVGSSVRWTRALLLLAAGVSVLAGFGLDAVVRRGISRRLALGIGLGLAACAAVTGIGWLTRNHDVPLFLPPYGRAPFLWAAGTAAAAAVVVVVAAWRISRRSIRPQWSGWPLAAVVLLVTETAFLVPAGTVFWSTAPVVSTSSSVARVHQLVGSSLLGFGESTCSPLPVGIQPDTNLELGLQELTVYEPLTPVTYYSSFRALTGGNGGLHGFGSTYCPVITSADVAKRYGVGYVLEQHGAGAFPGAEFVASTGIGDLYRVPGSGPATVSALGPHRAIPPPDAPGTLVPASHPGPASWKVRTSGSAPQVLRLRLTDVPGWHATIDGRPLALRRYGGVMLQAVVPAGSHTIVLRYWPRALSIGLVLAALSALALVIAAGAARSRRVRSGSGRTPPPPLP